MRVISIDPGIMTGFCYAEITAPGVDGHYGLKFFPFQATDEVDTLWDRLARFEPRFIVIEDFEFRRGTYAGAGGGGLELFPVQLIGVTRLYEIKAKSQCAVFIQKAAQGKAYYTDKMLKSYGLYRRGVPHGMDAARHLLHWYTFGGGNRYCSTKKVEEAVTMVDKTDWWN